jgi:hypothetical protein
MFYTERILPQVQEKVGGLDNLPKKERLPFIQRVTRDLFEGETEEIKAAVEAKLKELRESAAESDDDAISPENYQRFVPVWLSKFER